MTTLSDMPMITIEQKNRFREAALQVEAERDALAARNAELHDIAGILLCIDQCETCKVGGEFDRDGVKQAISREALASLAARDARMKAEALDELAAQPSMEHFTASRSTKALSAEYRKQAEGGNRRG